MVVGSEIDIFAGGIPGFHLRPQICEISRFGTDGFRKLCVERVADFRRIIERRYSDINGARREHGCHGNGGRFRERIQRVHRESDVFGVVIVHVVRALEAAFVCVKQAHGKLSVIAEQDTVVLSF